MCYSHGDVFLPSITVGFMNMCIVNFKQVFVLDDIYYNLTVEIPESLHRHQFGASVFTFE